jgi:hypothetical protein
MGGVIGQLSYLYCRSGCQASVVASALTFHPPNPPFYKFVYDEATSTYTLEFATQANAVKYDDLTVELLRTSTHTTIPLVCLRHKGAKYTVIYSHGNATDCGAMFFLYAMLAVACKVNVVGYDYTGYGASIDGGVAPTEKQTYKDIERVYDWCVETQLVKDPAKEIIAYGQSVGSGPSTYLAMKRPVAGLILHSPIMSGIRVLTPSRLLACFDIFPNIDRVRKVRLAWTALSRLLLLIEHFTSATGAGARVGDPRRRGRGGGFRARRAAAQCRAPRVPNGAILLQSSYEM